MKKTLALTLCFGMALPLIANAEPKDKEEKERRKAEKRNAKIEQMIARPDQQRGGEAVREARQENREARREDRREERRDTRNRERDLQPQIAVQQPQVAAQQQVSQPQIAAQPEVNTEVRRREGRRWNNERRGPRTHSWSYDEARRYHRRERRDRDWWRSNYSRFALFGGGYYYWDRGYWYPAYGYDPSYSTYTYDEPIYGYNQMEPRQVLVRVQRELRRDGYYRGAIDGLIGPQTRAALARFQRDNGLYVTRRIDGPTLAALGVV